MSVPWSPRFNQWPGCSHLGNRMLAPPSSMALGPSLCVPRCHNVNRGMGRTIHRSRRLRRWGHNRDECNCGNKSIIIGICGIIQCFAWIRIYGSVCLGTSSDEDLFFSWLVIPPLPPQQATWPKILSPWSRAHGVKAPCDCFFHVLEGPNLTSNFLQQRFLRQTSRVHRYQKRNVPSRIRFAFSMDLLLRSTACKKTTLTFSFPPIIFFSFFLVKQFLCAKLLQIVKPWCWGMRTIITQCFHNVERVFTSFLNDFLFVVSRPIFSLNLAVSNFLLLWKVRYGHGGPRIQIWAPSKR